MSITSNIKGDITGGISAGIVTLPVALAYGVATGMGPAAGMYTAVILGLLAAIFGGTNTQISCPTGAMTVVVAFIVGQEVSLAGSLEKALPILIIIFLLTGIFQILIGVFRFGLNIRYVPYSVVSGFMSGIGIIIILLQVKDVTGVYNDEIRSIPSILMNMGHFVMNVHWETLVLSSATLIIIYTTPKISKKIPGGLAALIIVSAVSYFAGFDVKRLGDISFDLSHLSMSLSFDGLNSEAIARIALASFSLALLGSINTLLTSVVADKMTKTMHNSNRELIGQGVGNLIAGLFGGFPGSGATACTVANIQAGGQTKLSGVISSVFLLVVLLFGMDLAGQIPYSVLGGILVYIGVVLIDTETLKKINKIPKADNFVMLTVLTLTVLWNLLYAVLLGLIFAAFYFMKKMADVVEVDTEKTKVDSIVDQVIKSFQDDKGFGSKVLIKTIKGPVFFGFSSRFLVSMRNIPNNIQAVVFDLSLVPYMDHSGLRTFMEVIQFLSEKKVNICFSSVGRLNLQLLQDFEIVPKLVDERHIFESVEECIMWLKEPGHLENSFAKDDELYVPPAFTPNGDGINDDWEIKNIDKYPNAEIKIFNPEDRIVYESTGYKEPWGGMINNELLPPGEYKYQIKLMNDTAEVREGSVFLFR